MNDLQSLWYDQIDRTLPLAAYPRPQMTRPDWLCLNGSYDYAVTPAHAPAPTTYDGKILVPFSIESAASGVGRALQPEELLWYHRTFTLTDAFCGKRTLLHFDAVDWQCTIWVNGTQVGVHTGGYNPFSFDITDVLCDGENDLLVQVYDPTDAGHQQRGKQILDVKGFWYTATSGIWQTVWLEPVAPSHIESLRLTPDIDAGTLTLDVKHTGGRATTLCAEILAGEQTVFSGPIDAHAVLSVPEAHLWSPEDPFLYTLNVTLADGESADAVGSYFGMRKFSIVTDAAGLPRLALNNKPYFQRGLLDQGYWPESQLTPPTDEAMIFDIEQMKALGFNMLRKHIKREPMRWYYHCDRLGMLVWQDMISGGKPLNPILAGVLPNINVHMKDNLYKSFNRDEPAWREEFKAELFEMIDQLYNCVSICCWVPFNEGWGQFDALEIGRAVKQLDPSRFVDHASGWHDQGGPDFKSVHKYIFPIHLPTKRRTAGRPFVLSEYGGYSEILPDHVWNRRKSFGYMMFRSKESLSAAYRNLHEKQVAPLIAKGLCATVYTQVSDVEFEVNGIYTYDRKVLKLDADMLRAVNSLLTY